MRMIGIAAVGFTACLAFIMLLVPEVSAATGESSVDVASSVFVFLCTALVFIMAPAIALFYGGMLRKQSMTSMMAQCIGVMAVSGFIWWAVGYSLALTGDGAVFGGFGAVFGEGLSISSGDGSIIIPTYEYMLFQGTFAVVTSCIVFGATAERVRYSAILVFIALWSVLVYAPMAHMVWGGGLIHSLADIGLPNIDFAGGTVVHICSGISGVAAAVAIGRRSGKISKGRTHNVPLMFIGCFLLWVGWFGFNCGSAGGFSETAVLAGVNTFVASCVSTVVWIVVQYLHVGRVNVTGLCAGVLAGLVAITPGCGFVEPWAAVPIGAIGAVVCYYGIIFMRARNGVDDALDVMGVHGFGGIWGAISVGVFATAAYSGYGGLIEGQVDLLAGQVVSVLITLVYCFVVSFVIMKAVDYVMRNTGGGKGAALTESEQMIGADTVEHGEPSYVM